MKLADYNGHLVTLCLMATGTFAIGTDAFIVAGVLSDIPIPLPSAPRKRAVDIGIRAGLYAVRATDRPLLGNVNRKHILQLALVLFIAGNLACARPPATCRSRSAECWPHWERPVTRRRPPPPPWGWWRKTPRPRHFHRLWGA